MNEVTSIHERAMELSDHADIAARAGKAEEARLLYRRAAMLEERAASAVPIHEEPTRSILFRSAATLYLEGGATHNAIRIIRIATLAGSPPYEIRKELNELLRTAEEVL